MCSMTTRKNTPRLSLYHGHGDKTRAMPVGARIKQARKKAGLTQAQLADACGWEEGQSRISNYENGYREPGRDEVNTIASVLGISISDLWPELKQTTSLGKQTGETLEKGPLIDGYIRVPIVGTAQLGEGGYWVELEYPAGAGDGYVDVPSHDPNAYALRVRGNSMAPAIRDGWIVVMEPNTELVPEEYVLVSTKDGQKMIKQLLWLKDDRVGLLSVSDSESPFSLYLDEVESLQYVGLVVPPSRRRLG